MQRSDSLTPRMDRMLLVAAMVAICGIALTSLLFVLEPTLFFPSYLVAFLYWMDLTLGCLGVLLLVQLVQGDWGLAVERILAAGARTIVVMALFFIPLLIGLPQLYSWTTSADFQAAHAHQALPYLSVPFWVTRAVLAFLICGGLAYGVTQWSYQQDQSPVRRRGHGLARLAALGILLFVIISSMTAFDWSMSLDPFWFSSIYGWLATVRQGLAAMAFSIIVLALIGRTTTLSRLITEKVVGDLGMILLATIMLWAYMSFFQFLIIWYNNIPHYARWYVPRTSGGWESVAFFLGFFHFAIPFVMLILPGGHRTLGWFAGVAGLLMVTRLVELHWLVKPAFYASPVVGWLDLALPITMGALWVLIFLWSLRSYRLVPVGREQSAPSSAHAESTRLAV
jgi:hypothetical protein